VIQIDKLATGQQIARARDIERGREPNRLSEDDHEAFQELLGKLTLERESVKEVMGFALDNSEAAVDIVHTLREAFHRRKDSSAVALVGFLFVASDILHNSSAAVKNASLFRTTFQDCLPEIMDVLRVVHKNILGRMSANAMKEKVLSVLTAWESWSLFPPGYLVGLNATFMRKVEEADFMASHGTLLEQVSDSDEERLRKMCKQAGILSSGSAKDLFGRLQWLKEFTAPVPAGPAAPRPAVVSTSAPRRASPDIASASVSVPSVKPEVNAEDVDGEPMDDEDLDGEPMGDDNDLDGEPMDEDSNISVVEDSSRAKTSADQAVDDDDIDGVPLDEDNNDEDPKQAEEDIDGLPIDDGELDGEPIDDELDGVPLDEDLDGEPI
jgi:U2-associated protein SR140